MRDNGLKVHYQKPKVNLSKYVWSEGSKAHSEEKEIGLESALSEWQWLESTLEGKKR